MTIPKASLLLAVVALAGASGCAMEQQQVEQQLASNSRIDCRTAPGDLRVLQQEKANVVQRVAEGATAIYPAGAVFGVATGVEGTRIQVATREYNAMIDRRIAEIQQPCGIQ